MENRASSSKKVEKHLLIHNEVSKYNYYENIRKIKKNLRTHKEDLKQISDQIEKNSADLNIVKSSRQKHSSLQNDFQRWLKIKNIELTSIQGKLEILNHNTANPKNINPSGNLGDIDVSIQNLNEQIKIEKEKLEKYDLTAYHKALSTLNNIDKELPNEKKRRLAELQQDGELTRAKLRSINNQPVLKEMCSSLLTHLDSKFKIIDMQINLIKNEYTVEIAEAKAKIEKAIETITSIQLNINNLNHALKELEVKKETLKIEMEVDNLMQVTTEINLQDLLNANEAILKEIKHKKNTFDSFERKLINDENNLINKLNILITDHANLKSRIQLIEDELKKPVSFARGYFINEDKLKEDLRKEKLHYNWDEITNNILTKCDWKKISSLKNRAELVNILKGFYEKVILKKNIPIESYAHYFKKFLVEEAISVEHEIPNEYLEYERARDSLARLIYLYCRHHKNNSTIGHSVAITIVDNKPILAINDREKNNDFKEKNFKQLKETLIEIASLIKNCPVINLDMDLSQRVEEQKKYILNLFATKFSKSLINLKMDRIYYDLLNLLNFEFNQLKYEKDEKDQKSLATQLEQVCDEDIHVYDVLHSKCFQHAELSLLMHISCEYLIKTAQLNGKLAFFPPDQPILMGLSKLSCFDCNLFFEVVNAIQNNENIIITGTHQATFYSDSFKLGEEFVRKLQKEIESKKNSLLSQQYNNVIKFLNDNLQLFETKIKESYDVAAHHSSVFRGGLKPAGMCGNSHFTNSCSSPSGGSGWIGNFFNGQRKDKNDEPNDNQEHTVKRKETANDYKNYESSKKIKR